MVCQTESNHAILLSSNTFGGLPDLDGRPPSMLRGTMGYWVQRCPQCGYCATDLGRERRAALPVIPLDEIDESPADSPEEPSSERRAFLESIVRGARYQAQLSDKRFPSLACSLLCQSMLDEVSGQSGRAALGAMHAAWVCDDRPEAKGQAAECRRRAVELIRDASHRGQQAVALADMPGIWTDELLITDLLRRSQAFEAAAVEAQSALAMQPEERLRSAFEYEVSLIQASDSGGRSLVDVIRRAPAAWGVPPATPKNSLRKVADAIRVIPAILFFMIGAFLVAAAFLVVLAVAAIAGGLDRIRAMGKRRVGRHRPS